MLAVQRGKYDPMIKMNKAEWKRRRKKSLQKRKVTFFLLTLLFAIAPGQKLELHDGDIGTRPLTTLSSPS